MDLCFCDKGILAEKEGIVKKIAIISMQNFIIENILTCYNGFCIQPKNQHANYTYVGLYPQNMLQLCSCMV